MEDKVPDILEFETLRDHETSNKTENILKLNDPPVGEDSQPVTNETDNKNIENEKITVDCSNDELLDLNEPPNEEEIKEIPDSSNAIITDEVISQFAQNLVDPIVKEAIEIQKAEMEDSFSDEVKIDSSGDKKSEKSCSDDGFEYVKADEINSSNNLDQHNEEMHQMLDSESYNKDTEDDSFITEDLKIEDNDGYENSSPIKEHSDDMFLNDDLEDNSPDIVYASHNLPDQSESFIPVSKTEEEEDEECPSFIENFEDTKDEDTKEEDYVFDIQGIINASNLNPMKSEPIEPEEVEESSLEPVKSEEVESVVEPVKSEEVESVWEPVKSEEVESDLEPVKSEEVKSSVEHVESQDVKRSLDPVESESQDVKSSLEPIESPESEETSVEHTSRSSISQKFRDIFCWKNPIVSAIILSAIMLIEFGLMCDYSIISLLAYSGLLLLGSSFVYKFAIKFNLLKKCDQSECTISVSSDDIQICVDCVLKSIEHLFNEIRSLTYVTSFTKNLKAFTFFWILTYIGQWFNLLSLIFLGTIISFSLPIFYTTYKDTIDQVTNDVCGRVKESIDKLKSKSQKLTSFRAR